MAKVLKAGEIKMLDQLIQQVGYNFQNASEMIDAVEKQLQTKRKGHNLSKVAKDYIEAAYLAAKSANTNGNGTSTTTTSTTGTTANNEQGVGQMGTAAQDTTTGAKDIPNGEDEKSDKNWDWTFKVNPNKIVKNLSDGKVMADAISAGVKASVEVVLDKKFNTGCKAVDDVYKNIFRGLFNF